MGRPLPAFLARQVAGTGGEPERVEGRVAHQFPVEAQHHGVQQALDGLRLPTLARCDCLRTGRPARDARVQRLQLRLVQPQQPEHPDPAQFVDQLAQCRREAGSGLLLLINHRSRMGRGPAPGKRFGTIGRETV